MAYYPKSQIKTNLYTNGNEYLLSTTNEYYQGYYYEISTGQKYTGATPNTPPNTLLITPSQPFKSEIGPPQSDFISIATDLIPIDLSLSQKRYLPTFNLTTPTSQDQQNGQFTRYFCKRNNEFKYLEISKTTFNQLYTKSPEIAWDLYTPVSILWQIKGDKNKVYVSNKALTESIETKFKWYGFSQYFQGKFLKYYVES
jgi:hypothetical protein